MRLFAELDTGPRLSHDGTNCRTLVVEDDADSREAMVKALGLFGYTADCAGTFLEGVAKLSSKVRWLILDLGLPDGDGGVLLRHIRQNDLPVRVAVVTGAGNGSQLAEAVLLKPDAFFTKPIEFEDLATWMASGDHGAGGGNSFPGMPMPM